jgi:hypothetical protein
MARRLRSAYRRRRRRLYALGAAAGLGALAGVLASVWLGERMAALGLAVGPGELQRFALLVAALAGIGWGIGWLVLRLTARRADEAGNLSSPS